MKTFIIIICSTLSACCALAQGTVNFVNNSSSLVYLYNQGPLQVMPAGNAPLFGPFYFSLLTAPPGSTSFQQFTFSGLYATNTSMAGIFNGGSNIAVPGWAPGTARAYVVFGWSSTLGHDWNPNWLVSGLPQGQGFFTAFGDSSIGTGIAGGITSSATLPPLDLFAPSSGLIIQLQTNLIPEPQMTSFLGLSTAALLYRNRCLNQKRPR